MQPFCLKNLAYCSPVHQLTDIEDDKLSDDVVRKRYSDSRHALCCLECGFEWKVDPTVKDSIGRSAPILFTHNCKEDGD